MRRFTIPAASILTASILAASCSANSPAATTATTATPSGQCRSDNYLGCAEKTFTGSGPTVAVIGDSITYQSRTQLHNALDDHSVKVSGLVGSTAAENMATARQYAPDRPAAVVINVGTNDALLSIPTTDTIAAYDQIIGQFAASCVVVVTISERGTGTTTDGHVYSPGRAAAINAWMRGRGERVVDWEAAIAADPTLVVDDGMHPTETGKQRLANLIAAEVSTCPSAAAAN